MNRLSIQKLLRVLVSFSLLSRTQSDFADSASCLILASSQNANLTAYPIDGITVYYSSYEWCSETPSCRGLGSMGQQATADFVLILTSFALPAVIFSTVIPRRWRLDVPERLLKVDWHKIYSISKLMLAIPTVCIVATADMIGWITYIMTFAGPMAFSGVQEVMLDLRVVTFLAGSQTLSVRDRVETVIALLCGNFGQDQDDPTARIYSALIPFGPPEAWLEQTKSRLITVMNSQMSFGSTIGVPAIFFLVGFLYNAAQSSPVGAVSFGIFWMVLVTVTIISGTLLAGNSPHTVSMLVVDNHVRDPKTRQNLLVDIYESELYPVAMWDRGFSKYQWLRNTTLWQCSTRFRNSTEINGWSWAKITVVSWLLVATPCLLSFSSEYLIPFPWFGCHSLLYTTYLITQTWLVLIAFILAYLDKPFHAVWRPCSLLPKNNARPIFLRAYLVMLTGLTGGAALIAAIFTIVGSGFQLSETFGSCFCSSPVSTWLEPALARPAFLSYDFTLQSYYNYQNNLMASLYQGAAIFTFIVCSLGWWYHRALRSALRDVIEGIE